MFVIGTSGHVDHGKTTLIEALTGINPDRLPEEKERGMTIDLGFAFFQVGEHDPVGVIDVPGHERFIRNMVAGAWSLDCALLLVAADDGWMRQTGDHALVLASLGIGRIILVVTKTDIVEPDRVQEVKIDALRRCERIFGGTLDSIEVSALQGRNIEELKQLIMKNLASIKPAPQGFPYLYIDRIFTLKGSGLVVAGSLKGAPIHKDEQLVLLPCREQIRIRSIQTYKSTVEKAFPVSRVALNLQKPKHGLQRGDCIASPDAPFFCEKELFIRVRPVPKDPSRAQDLHEPGQEETLKNHAEIEVALGTGHRLAQIHFLDDRRYARIVLRERLPVLWNQPCLIIQHGGSTILGSGSVVWAGETDKEERKRLGAVLATLPEHLAEKDLFLLNLRFKGALKRTGKEAAGDLSANDTVGIGPWIFHKPYFDAVKEHILKLSSLPEGVSVAELVSKLKTNEEPLKAVLSFLERENSILCRNGLYFRKQETQTEALSALGKKLLADIAAAGTAGFELSKTGIEGAQKELKVLIRLGYVVSLEGNIYYTKDVYLKQVRAILENRKPGDTFSIPQAKEATGLSRKYMLPLLNRMESDGFVKRSGDNRIVLKLLQ